MNFASRTACRKCGTAKGQTRTNGVASPAQGRPGDWSCTVCGYLNYATNKACRACKTVPSLVSQQSSFTGANASTNNAPRSGTPTQKPGDWNCHCGELNFARNQNCRKCHVPKPSMTSTTNTLTTSTVSTTEESQNQCVVCMAATADTAITVCGHMALCMTCASAMSACPLCRAQYSQANLLKIFIAGV